MKKILSLIVGVGIVLGVIKDLLAEEKYIETYVKKDIFTIDNNVVPFIAVNNKGDKIGLTTGEYFSEYDLSGRKILEIDLNKIWKDEERGRNIAGFFFDEKDNIYIYTTTFRVKNCFLTKVINQEGKEVKEITIPWKIPWSWVEYHDGAIYDFRGNFLVEIKKKEKVTSIDFTTEEASDPKLRFKNGKFKVKGFKKLGLNKDEVEIDYEIPMFSPTPQCAFGSSYVTHIDKKDNLYIKVVFSEYFPRPNAYLQIFKVSKKGELLSKVNIFDKYVDRSELDSRLYAFDEEGNIYKLTTIYSKDKKSEKSIVTRWSVGDNK